MAEACSVSNNEDLPVNRAPLSQASETSDCNKTTDCTSPSPTETICLESSAIPGPSNADDRLQPVADKINSIVRINDASSRSNEGRDGDRDDENVIEENIVEDQEFLDLNEDTQERILQDNKTPDRSIKRENIINLIQVLNSTTKKKDCLSDSIVKRRCDWFSSKSSSACEGSSGSVLQQRTECFRDTVGAARSVLSSGNDGALLLDPGNDALCNGNEMDEDAWEDCCEETSQQNGIAMSDVEDEVAEEVDEDDGAPNDGSDVSQMSPLHETATTATPNTRSRRKRKLDAQAGFHAFPCKKLFPENKTACGADGGDNHYGACELCPALGEASASGATPHSAEKKRSVIPTKDNPPPEMTGWLSQFQRWSNAERLMALDELIDRCEPTQVRHMMAVIEPRFQRDFISLLPKELALSVLAFLEPRDLLRAAQTCSSWRYLADDNLLWKEKCRQAGIDSIKEVTSNSKKGRSRSPKIAGSPWKAAFMRQHTIEMNWRLKPIRPPKVLKGHDDHVITCLQFCGNKIVSGSDDNTLKVWSATSGKCLRTLVGHTGGVWSSQMAGSTIVSGSTDRTLKVWNAETGDCVHTLYGHTSTVRCMHLHENKVVSGSRDATLRMWDVESGLCLHVLVGHLAAVRCVQYDGRLVVSGAYDYMVKVWNPDREECLHTLQGHSNRVYSLQFDGVHVVSGSLDTSIRVWEVETGACKHTLMGHQSLTSGMELRNNILVSGNADSTVKVWDILTGQCLQTLSGPNKHQSAVTCLQFNSRFVITSSDDGTVKLWDVKTGAFVRNLVALDSGGSGGVVWRIRASDTKLVCAVGSRNGTEETKLLVLDFDVEYCTSPSATAQLGNDCLDLTDR